jgi:hypothetical protein
MSVRTTHVVSCDRTPCPAQHVGFDGARAARASAGQAGWEQRFVTPAPPRQFGRYLDFCPVHRGLSDEAVRELADRAAEASRLSSQLECTSEEAGRG